MVATWQHIENQPYEPNPHAYTRVAILQGNAIPNIKRQIP